MKFPFSFIVAALVLGIFLYFQYTINIKIILSLLAISIGFLVYFFKKNKKYLFVFGVSLVFMFFGYWNAYQKDPLQNEAHFTKFNKVFQDKNVAFLVIIEQELKPSAKYQRFIANIAQINQQKCSGKILFCVKKTDVQKPIIGNSILVVDKISKIPAPKNKYQFDYQKFMFNKDVFAQTYTSPEKIKIIDYQKNIYSISNEFRLKIIKAFEKQNISKGSLAIVKALLLGEKQDIDKDLYQSYSKSGAVHVLAISGLHIGLIVVFLVFILKPLQYFKNGNIASTIIILIILWCFAFISGLSASVVRAVTMYSFVALALFLNRKSNIYNTLLGSLMVLLIINPKFLFDVGFQLSYLAVFAIVYIQPIIKKFYQPKNKVTQYFYDIFTVSVAAQLGVMPLSIYYFHQFPGLFFVTNFLVIPLLTIVLFLGFVSILISFFTDIPYFLVKIIDVLVWITNYGVVKIASIESFILTNIYSSFLLTITTTIVVFLFFSYLKNKRFYQIKQVFQLSIFAFSLFYFYQIKSYFQTENLVFFDTKELVVLEKKGFQLNYYSTQKKIDAQDFENYKRENFIEKLQFFELKNFTEIDGQKILILDKPITISKNIKPDILIIHNSPKMNLERILEKIKPKKVVFTPKNYKKNIENWSKIFKKNKISIYNMYENGYFEF